jgi:hypothetical protein
MPHPTTAHPPLTPTPRLLLLLFGATERELSVSTESYDKYFFCVLSNPTDVSPNLLA